MVRFALALAAIVILALSAWPIRGQLRTMPLNTGTGSTTVFQNNTDSFRAELMPLKRTPNTPIPRLTNEEPPAPALLVYLALILIGSAGSVALTRRRLHGES